MPEIPREQEIYYEKKLTPEVVEPEVDLMVVNPEWSAKRLNSGWPNQAPDSRARNRARTQHYFNICLKDWLDHLWDTRYDDHHAAHSHPDIARDMARKAVSYTHLTLPTKA